MVINAKMSTIATRAAFVVAVALAVPGCSSPARQADATTVPAATTAAAPAAAHNHADVMFAHMMIPHHQQAIEMSDVLLAKQGIDQRVADLARQIKAAQQPEIDQMRGWLNDWGVPAMPMAPGDGGMPGMHHGQMPGMDHGMGGMTGMGMVSQADMDALRAAQGVQASRLFLTHMIAHHEGAIRMARDAINNGQYPAAIEMSRSIVISQQKEIDTMNQILPTL